MIKVIFFDFDGVLIESVDIKTDAFARLFEAEGKGVVKKVVDYHLQNAGVSRYDKFRFIYEEILHRPLTDDVFRLLCDKFSLLVKESVIAAPYVKGAEGFLKDHSSKYRCFVVSATPQEEIEEIIARRGMLGFFKGIYGAPTKKTEAVRKVIRAERIAPDEALYVGDAMSDYSAARDNSAHFIARISDRDPVFSGVECLKAGDLRDLTAMIGNL